VEEANFIKKLHKGAGKYKGKLPFKCFNCGKVGHFVAKCPYPKEYSKDEENKTKQYKKKEKPNYKKKIYKRKKNFYSKEENNSSSESSDSDESNDDEVLFLGIEESKNIEEIKQEKESKDEA
jgi:predicted ATP-dependent serine protease